MVVVPQAYFYRRWRDPTQTPPPTHCPLRGAWFGTKIHNVVLQQVRLVYLMHLRILSDNTAFIQKTACWRQQVHTSIHLLTVVPHNPSLKSQIHRLMLIIKRNWRDRSQPVCCISVGILCVRLFYLLPKHHGRHTCWFKSCCCSLSTFMLLVPSDDIRGGEGCVIRSALSNFLLGVFTRLSQALKIQLLEFKVYQRTSNHI